MAAMNIAKHVIGKCGGAANVARWLGRQPARVYHWTYPRERGGTNGLIPANEHLPLLIAARGAGYDLLPIDFFGITELPSLEVAHAAETMPAAAPDHHTNSREKLA